MVILTENPLANTFSNHSTSKRAGTAIANRPIVFILRPCLHDETCSVPTARCVFNWPGSGFISHIFQFGCVQHV